MYEISWPLTRKYFFFTTTHWEAIKSQHWWLVAFNVCRRQVEEYVSSSLPPSIQIWILSTNTGKISKILKIRRFSTSIIYGKFYKILINAEKPCKIILKMGNFIRKNKRSKHCKFGHSKPLHKRVMDQNFKIYSLSVEHCNILNSLCVHIKLYTGEIRSGPPGLTQDFAFLVNCKFFATTPAN